MTRNPQMVLTLAIASIFFAFGKDRWRGVWAALTKATSGQSTGDTGANTKSVWARLDPDNDGWVTVYRIGDDGSPENKTSGAERYIKVKDLPSGYYDGKELCPTGNILVVASEDIADETDAYKLRQLCVVREAVVNADGMAKRKAENEKNADGNGGYAYSPAFGRVPVFAHYQKFFIVPKVREHEGMQP